MAGRRPAWQCFLRTRVSSARRHPRTLFSIDLSQNPAAWISPARYLHNCRSLSSDSERSKRPKNPSRRSLVSPRALFREPAGFPGVNSLHWCTGATETARGSGAPELPGSGGRRRVQERRPGGPAATPASPVRPTGQSVAAPLCAHLSASGGQRSPAQSLHWEFPFFFFFYCSLMATFITELLSRPLNSGWLLILFTTPEG